MFDVGDNVVYPHHGAGTVVSKDTRIVLGQEREYLTIKILHNDMTVNVTREKKLTNVRASGKDDNILLTPPIRMTLERALSYIQEDELVEVTPKSIRLRKKMLDPTDRKRAVKSKEALAS